MVKEPWTVNRKPDNSKLCQIFVQEFIYRLRVLRNHRMVLSGKVIGFRVLNITLFIIRIMD